MSDDSSSLWIPEIYIKAAKSNLTCAISKIVFGRTQAIDNLGQSWLQPEVM